MSVKVSVVIPVYNPGPYIEDCISSLLRQSLPDDAYEAIFVNDGSTDETPARLDRLAAEHPHMHVIHQEPSGWSGKPRNVGIAAAQGEFVMFVDNDDWLGDEALERMYEYGVANDADVIVGKMAGKGRPVPLELFRVNRPRASVDNAPLIDSLTPHKMFRKSFLDSHDIRFKEGRRRLEDHVFVAETYLLASNIAVLSDYLCYYHVKREDASNAGFQRFDPVGYFANLREALDVVERNTEPGALRDKLYRRWLRNEMVERLRGRRLLALPEDYRRELYDEIRKVVVERMGPGVAAGLAPTQQIVAALIVADRFADLEELARWEAEIKPTAWLESLGWEAGALRIGFTAEYEVNGSPITFRTEDGEDRLGLPFPAETVAEIRELGASTAAPVDRAKVDLVVRERATAAEFYQPVELTRERVAEDGAFRLLLHAESVVDPEIAANRAPLGPGIWDIHFRISACGWTKEARLGAVRGENVDAARQGALSGAPRRLVLPYWTEPHGNVSLDVDHATSRFDRDVADITPTDVTYDAGTLAVPVRLHTADPQDVRLRLTDTVAGGKTETPATLVAKGDASLLTAELPAPPTGRAWRLELGLPSAKRGAPRWTALPVGLKFTEDGAATVVAASALPRKKKAAPAATVAPAKRPLLRRVLGRVRRSLSR
ncbi:glycosyltransferase family 2 protein [Streptomyces liangshanensis]|uniref:Glycosyltransferase family 2 protein n=1 Tax=Streptomyces liangshanensis TaxID=2717324 RepID=A0A6G9H3H8_9ACTN|nr:glycosyltransferase family A protein [Streptomyces liangshanensis]QIQ04856.1 glycosyltransferase family 2 protein [Streptomyces liangshanensis]